ncbi:heme ABC transporter permease [Thioflexithrix psekupsensis]|uniref:Heme exporter protein C n=1 Tax=Thioflexithrix psekupsensis TaxID=1570016 RepID=A0A251X6E5_9GAMM|nr:heme ABC transporter permease [Thioflexithrix psekupsensis]OUD13192.1 heme ABC transporter permease [Thioflexithrix psekupsensis]
MWAFVNRLSSPRNFYHFAGRWIPWLGAATVLLLAAGLYGGLVLAPPDYQQGESFRIIYVHVPAAWLGMFSYAFMAGVGAIGLIWRIKLAEAMAASVAPIGASFAFLALVTGALWGKPMWGAWWVWDARLTSTLILFFLYLGVIALNTAIEDKRNAARASAVLAIVGVVNIPIIVYSVEWWNTLHQKATISIIKFQAPSIHLDMLIPLFIMALAFKLFFFTVLFMRTRGELLDRERHSRWVQELVGDATQMAVLKPSDRSDDLSMNGR